MQYTLEYYQEIVRTPMLKFKLRIETEHCKGQDREEIEQRINKDIMEASSEYKREMEELEEEDDEGDGDADSKAI